MTVTEELIKEIVLDPEIYWDPKHRLLEHYRPVIDARFYHSMQDEIFFQMLDEIAGLMKL